MPLDQPFRVGTGLQYAPTNQASIGVTYECVNFGDTDFDRDRGPLSGRPQGNYSTNEIHFFNVTLSWKL